MTKEEKLVELRDKYREFLREDKTEEATNVANKMIALERGESAEPEKKEEKEEVFKNQDSPEEFQKINGVGPEIAMILQDRFGKVKNIVKLDKKKLLNIPGIGKKKVESIRKEVSEKW